MITIREATPEERTAILRDVLSFSGPIPDSLHLTDQEVYELCGGTDYRGMIEAIDRENREWLLASQRSVERILRRDGELESWPIDR